jgi:hypothetical protein
MSLLISYKSVKQLNYRSITSFSFNSKAFGRVNSIIRGNYNLSINYNEWQHLLIKLAIVFLYRRVDQGDFKINKK